MIPLALETARPEGRNDNLALPLKHPEKSETTFGVCSSQILAASLMSQKQARLKPADTKATPLSNSLEDKLYDNSAAVKINFGLYARHLPDEWRQAIFQDIDRLLCISDWDEESALINETSFKTFLRFLVHTPPAAMPALGVNHDGSLLAAWIKGEQKVTVSFLPNDQAKAILIGPTLQGEQEILAWLGNVASLYDFIARNRALYCLE